MRLDVEMLALESNTPFLDEVMDLFRDNISWYQLAVNPHQRYVMFVPDDVSSESPVMLCVHGVSRNAETMLYSFASWAARLRVVLIAPLFDSLYFVRYPCLTKDLFDRRADANLDAIIDEVQKKISLQSKMFHLFGFSGGAQYAQRYMMMNPHKVSSLIAVSAEWYTFPDCEVNYPRGIRVVTSTLPGFKLIPQDFLKVPCTVIVGSSLSNFKRDLVAGNPGITSRMALQQGETRAERGRRWVAAMDSAAKERGLNTLYAYEELSSPGDSFEVAVREGRLGALVAGSLSSCVAQMLL